MSLPRISGEPIVARSSKPSSLICPGCGATVVGTDADAMFVGDVVSTPVQIAKCIAVGIVLGLVAGAVIPYGALQSASAGAILIGGVAWLLARRYNARVEREPVDHWPNSVSCPECGRVFRRYQDGGGPEVTVWP